MPECYRAMESWDRDRRSAGLSRGATFSHDGGEKELNKELKKSHNSCCLLGRIKAKPVFFT